MFVLFYYIVSKRVKSLFELIFIEDYLLIQLFTRLIELSYLSIKYITYINKLYRK